MSTAVRTSVRNHGRFSCVSESPTQMRIGGAFGAAREPGAVPADVEDGTQFLACCATGAAALSIAAPATAGKPTAASRIRMAKGAARFM
ncbi:hypothetical protein BDI4_120150 [Burkholderia diffusa]|nr:hypothetical protein BDI4_120150 [Burkholderia diffusa]